MTPKKYFTLSFDDGVTQDARLIEIMKKHDVYCCTFNVNTGILGMRLDWIGEACNCPGLLHQRYTDEEIRSGIYDGFEMAVHTYNHPPLNSLDDTPDNIALEINLDADNIESICGIYPTGMAYPGGDACVSDRTVEIIRERTKMRYARLVTPTYGFDMPTDFLRWYPTCSFFDGRVFEIAEKFLAEPCEKDMLFYVWGHAYEMDILGESSYGEFERLICMMKDAGIEMVTNREVYERVTGKK